jgi:hypothetical protein
MVIYSPNTSNKHWITCLTTTGVACAVGASAIMSSTDFSFQNLVVRNLFEYSNAEITLKSISPQIFSYDLI